MKMKQAKKHTRKRRKNPAFGALNAMEMIAPVGDLLITSVVSGCSIQEKAVIASILQSFVVPFIRKARDPKTPGEVERLYRVHWDAFRPHCPQILGVSCPPDCKNHDQAKFDGCHVCDCLHGSDPK